MTEPSHDATTGWAHLGDRGLIRWVWHTPSDADPYPPSGDTESRPASVGGLSGLVTAAIGDALDRWPLLWPPVKITRWARLVSDARWWLYGHRPRLHFGPCDR